LNHSDLPAVEIIKKRSLINPVEIEDTERALVYLSQKQTFRATRVQLKMHDRVNHDNNFAPLAPFIDPQGAIRLGGRTEAAHLTYTANYPLLLHCKDPITKIVVTHVHQRLEHSSGPRGLFTEMNKKYWLPKATRFFRELVHTCVPCRKRLAIPTTQSMAPLPFYRQPSSRLHPFDVSAIDVAGPYDIKIGRSMVKHWLLVIRCATVGAIHCEMIDSMDASSFLLAIERFLAVRPRPSVFLADNGRNFRGGKTALENKPAKDQIDLEKAQEHFNLEFRFAPPKAPHFQGLVERFVGAAKAAIHSAVRAHTLTDEELRTVFSGAMGHLNNIPVAYTVKSDADFHNQPLTPSHFFMESAYNELQPKDGEAGLLSKAIR
jgi:hypothetical protein